MNEMHELEVLGQTTIFDFMDAPVIPKIEIGSQVRIDISNSDEQSVDYFEHYYPHIINKSGIVRDKKSVAAGYTIFFVEVENEFHWMNENEVVKVL